MPILVLLQLEMVIMIYLKAIFGCDKNFMQILVNNCYYNFVLIEFKSFYMDQYLLVVQISVLGYLEVEVITGNRYLVFLKLIQNGRNYHFRLLKPMDIIGLDLILM